MPQRKNLTWGKIPQQRVRSLLEVILDRHNYSPKLLNVEWQEGQRDRYRLLVHYTTKANIVKLMTKTPYPSENKKAEIQDAIAHLEELQILTDLRQVKTGAKAENLSFYLELPSQDSSKIMKFILEEQWLKKSSDSSDRPNDPAGDQTIPRNSNEAIASANSEKNSEKNYDYELTAQIEQQGNQTIVRWQLKLSGNLAELTPEYIKKLQTVVREIAGEDRQNIMNITAGSIIIEFAGSEAGFKRIQSLFNRGELTEIAGFPVASVEQVIEPVNLSQWRQDIFPAAWQAIASLLTPQQMQLAFGWRSAWEPEIIRGHEINLGANLAATSLVLVVGLATENEAKTRICLQLHPTPQQNYLPPNLQLILLDERKNPVLATATENSTSRFLQLDFRGDLTEPFSVKISLGSDTITKNFVI
jgi:hypothetical protein